MELFVKVTLSNGTSVSAKLMDLHVNAMIFRKWSCITDNELISLTVTENAMADSERTGSHHHITQPFGKTGNDRFTAFNKFIVPNAKHEMLCDGGVIASHHAINGGMQRHGIWLVWWIDFRLDR